MTTNTYEFQAEINQLLSLIINAFYSNKEIFLRELVSNSSDALDKIRYLSLTDKTCLGNQPELNVKIKADKDANTLSIIDTGIGMTKEDMVNNLGTIAKSGTKSFMESLQAGADISMIGQFGVGFYSAYLVADKVSVYSRSIDGKSHLWESCAGGTFTVTELENMPHDLQRGTCIVLELKDEQKEYLEENRLKEVLKKHSQYVGYDVFLFVSKTNDKEVTDDEEDNSAIEEKQESNKQDEEPVVEEVNNPSEKKTKTIKEVINEYELQNGEKPLWTRDPKEITKEEYAKFYKHLTNDWDDHASVKHFNVEGQIEFKSILFVPKKPPFGFMEQQKKKDNIKLYVRRVFINDDSENLCPDWLSFIKGVVDSEDLPLNVSREMLQQNKILKVIKKNIVKKSLELFEEMTDNNDDYLKFYESFSKNLKLGIHEDATNRDRLINLLRYNTTSHENTSLKDYCTRVKENQTDIYYLTGEDLETLKNSPFIEKCNKQGYEVLFMTEPIDEYVMQQVKTYKFSNGDDNTEFKFRCLSKEGVNFENDDEKKEKEEFENVCKKIKELLGDKVEKVVISSRLDKSPCVLVTNEYGWSAHMEKIMKMQALGDNTMSSYMSGKKTLELNHEHKIVKELKRRCSEEDKTFKDLTMLLYETSLLVSGFTLPKPTAYADRIHNMISLGLSLDDDDNIKNNTHDKNRVDVTNINETIMEEVD